MGHERSEAILRSIPFDFDLVLDVVRDRRLPNELASHAHTDVGKRNATGSRLTEQVVGNAAANSQVEELTAVETQPSSTTFERTIDHEGELLGGAERGDLAIDIPRLDVDPHDAPPTA